MGSESIVHEAEGRMGYWLRGHEGYDSEAMKARLQSFFTAKTLQIWRALLATSGL